jgi:hypothetical protein
VGGGNHLGSHDRTGETGLAGRAGEGEPILQMVWFVWAGELGRLGDLRHIKCVVLGRERLKRTLEPEGLGFGSLVSLVGEPARLVDLPQVWLLAWVARMAWIPMVRGLLFMVH